MTYMPFAKPVLVPDLKAAVTKDTFPNALTSAADTLGEVLDWTNLEAPKIGAARLQPVQLVACRPFEV